MNGKACGERLRVEKEVSVARRRSTHSAHLAIPREHSWARLDSNRGLPIMSRLL